MSRIKTNRVLPSGAPVCSVASRWLAPRDAPPLLTRNRRGYDGISLRDAHQHAHPRSLPLPRDTPALLSADVMIYVNSSCSRNETARPQDWWNQRPEERQPIGVSPNGVEYHYSYKYSTAAMGRGGAGTAMEAALPSLQGAGGNYPHLSHQKPPSLFRYSRTLTQITFFASLGGFLFGYDTGVITGALPLIRDELGTGPWTESMILSLTTLGGIVGAALGGPASDRFGRKLVVFACDLIYFAGACVMAFAPDITALCVGRAVIGVASGVSSLNIPIYLSELAPDRIRGSMVAVNTVMTDMGMLMSYAVGAALASSGHWRFMLGLSAVPATVQCLGVLLMPESPAWLQKKGLR